MFAMLPREHSIWTLPFGPREGAAGPTVKNLSVASKVHLTVHWDCLEEPCAHHRRTNCLLSTCLQKFFLWCPCLSCLVASLTNSPGKPLVFSWEAFDYQRFETRLPWGLATVLSSCLVCTLCTVKGCVVALRCLVKTLKWGRYVQRRLMNKAWQVQSEDVKYHFMLLD